MDTTAYLMREKLYTGTRIEIYRGIRVSDKKSVILKLLHHEHPIQKDIALLQHEYHLLKQLDFPGVIRAHEFIHSHPSPMLVLEDIAGQSLDLFLAKQPLDLTTFFHLALQLVNILEYLHRQHIIHKDIKPNNIIIEPNSLMIKLTDLSISSQLSEEIQEYESANVLEGTLAYMSPEQTGRMAHPTIDYRTDFYSLGITFFEMLAGRLPFMANDALEWVHCHIAKQPPLVTDFNSKVPMILAAIIAKLLAKTPEDRYASAVGLKADLQICQQQWLKKAIIEPFDLFQHDVYDHLHLSHKLYGREPQVEQLLSVFNRTRLGRPELLLVTGYAGIGKTAVIQEIYKPIVERHGYFIQGKFDQLQRGTPYSALITAFQGLVKQILSESEQKLNHLKINLVTALGTIGQVIIEVIPQVELIIGKQPALPSVGSQEAQSRFLYAFHNFVKVFAQAEHPLVIFLDDLQWADNASLSFIEILLSDSSSCCLLIIGAYRDNEVDVTHSLTTSLQHLQREKVPIESLQLTSLQLLDIQQLLADTFHSSPTKTYSLAVTLMEKTHGNPFFMKEFLKHCYQDHLIYFAYQQREWQWASEQIAQQAITNNVVDLLITKINRLSDASQNCLKLASCIGHSFSLKTLAIISEQNIEQTAKQLWELIQANLIRTLEQSYQTAASAENNISMTLVTVVDLHYRFIHDQIQQAAYQLIPSLIKQKVHLQIGRLLLKNKPLQEYDERLFEILDHFNHGFAFLTDPLEKQQIAQYNLWAGQKAKIGAAQSAAVTYLQSGLSLLPITAWESNYELTFNLYKELLDTYYLIGQYEQAEEYFLMLIKHARNILEKTEINLLKIAFYTITAKFTEAVALILSSLNDLGVKLSLKPNILQILKEITAVECRVHGRDIASLKLVPMTDHKQSLVGELLSKLIVAAYLVNQELSAIAMCKLLSVTLKYGYSDTTPTACIGYAIILLQGFNNYKKGLAYIKLTERMLSLCQTRLTIVKKNSELNIIINHWRYAIVDFLPMFMQNYNACLEVGDLSYALFNIGSYPLFLAFAGKPLSEQISALSVLLNFVNKIKNVDSFENNDLLLALCKYLHGDANLNKDIFISYEGNMHNRVKTSISLFSMTLSKFYYFGENYAKAVAMSATGEQFFDYTRGQIISVEHTFFYALAIAANFYDVSIKQQQAYLKQLKILKKRLARWASWCPVNFKHYYLLIAAEIARIKNNRTIASDLYEQAINLSHQQDCLHLLAISNECAAQFYSKIDKQHVAKNYVIGAYYAYQRWGAVIKCKLLEQHYPQWLIETTYKHKKPVTSYTITTMETTSNIWAQALDMLAVLKSMQAISSEIELDKLLQKLLQIVLEGSGAQRCVLVTQRTNIWIIEAEGTVKNTEKTITRMQITPVVNEFNMPLTLLNYIQRTAESVVINNALVSEQTLHDPYVKQAQPKSLLAMPIMHQGQLRRILYLENYSSKGAFTHQHLKHLQFLASQAAISFENAYLYYQATHDPLTGLANRNLLNKTFLQIKDEVKKSQQYIAILFLDLDHFKNINDTLGHDVGDKLLIHMAEQLYACLKSNDLAVRLGGDEFVIMQTDIVSLPEVEAFVTKLYENLSQAAIIHGHKLILSSSIGISIYPNDGLTIQTLLKLADQALYQAKQNGRNRHLYFSTLQQTNTNIAIATKNDFISMQMPQNNLQNPNTLITRKIEGYILLEKIHQNDHAQIYRGIRSIDNQAVIIKLLGKEHPTQKEIALLQHEYQLLQQLDFPGIIRALGFIKSRDYAILILEDLEWCSLDMFLADQSFDISSFISLALQLADIIEYLHQNHIIHKDIKPENIIFEPNTLTVKLTNLGISSQLTEEIQEYASTDLLEGTLAYISPEQTGRMARSIIDYRTDFYSLGVTFFEMLTGKLPFQANNSLEYIHYHVTKQPPLVTEFNPQVPATIAAIINKLLAKMPEDRYTSAAGLKADLKNCNEQWQTTRHIEPFTIGQFDVHDHLHFSYKLYGRESQVEQLLTIFERVSRGPAELLLVAGYPGIGKTSLIQEIYKPLIQQYGYFIQGKFDKLQRSNPYSALIYAFQNLVTQLNKSPNEKLNQLKLALLQALGNIGQVIIDVIPQVESIIGKQPPLPILSSQETQSRFHLVFQNFIQVFSKSEHPLVIFLDDLQWADSSSLNLIEQLLSNSMLRHLLFIGSYRDNEVNDDHPLRVSLNQMRKENIVIETLHLTPLRLNDINQLLMDTLYYPLMDTTLLATCILDKTNGNPFFIKEFLKHLYQKQLLYFKHESGQWQWHVKEIQHEALTDNVVDLLINQIHCLSTTSQHTLKMAACIGNQFSLMTLATICEQSLQTTTQCLWEIIQINLIRPLDQSYQTAAHANATVLWQDNISDDLQYRFIHDQIQQAAYQLIPDHAKQDIHLRIARLMLQHHSLHKNHEHLFVIMDHFNHSIALLTEHEDKIRIAQYNLWAGQKAKYSAAYSSAISYLQTGISLLSSEIWNSNYKLIYTLYKDVLDACYLDGQYDRAEEYFTILINNATNILDKGQIYLLKISQYIALSKWNEAVLLILSTLQLLGIKIPSKPSVYHILKAILAIEIQVFRRDIATLTLPAMNDPTNLMICKLLNQLIVSSYSVSQELSAVSICQLLYIHLRHGYSDTTPTACTGYALIAMHGFNNFQKGIAYNTLAEKMLANCQERLSIVTSSATADIIVNHWRYPLAKITSTILQYYQSLLELGDFSYAFFCIASYPFFLSAMGKPLSELISALTTLISFLDRIKGIEAKGRNTFSLMLYKFLKGDPLVSKESIIAFEATLLQQTTKTEIPIGCMHLCQLHYLLADYPKAKYFGAIAEEHFDFLRGQVVTVELTLFYALALTRNFNNVVAKEQAIYLKQLKRLRKRLERWASWCPTNYKHSYLLVEAEIARIKKHDIAAGDLYDHAIQLASQQNCLYILSVANECAANFYESIDKPLMTKHYIVEAYYSYQRWGSETKCKLLATQYSQWLLPYTGETTIESFQSTIKETVTSITVSSTISGNTTSIDMLGILKSTQAISSEIQLDKLLQKLIQIVLNTIDAQRCAIFVQQKNHWLVEAENTVSGKLLINLQGAQFENDHNIPVSILQYIQHTSESIMMGDVMNSKHAFVDPYVKRIQAKSILAMPILYQGQLRRILYLENTTVKDAFNNQHLQSLQLLVSQAAISLENASLYYQATHDSLTGLGNRTLLNKVFTDVALSIKQSQHFIAILFFDLDHFKQINDRFGHDVGDLYLIHMGALLKTCLRENDVAIRLGGDEFVVMLTNISQIYQIDDIVKKLYERFTEPVILQGHKLNCSSSMGISLYPNDGLDIQTLLKQADAALYQAKEGGRNRYQYAKPI